MYLINKNRNNEIILETLHYANGFIDRLLGLIPYKRLSENEGMFLTECSSIHTFFMNFPIDCFFIDKCFKVVKIKRNIPPMNVAIGSFSTKHIIEVSSVRRKPLSLDINDIVEIKN